MHPLLERQLRRHLGDEPAADPKLVRFLEAVDAAYREADTDRLRLERSLDLVSSELVEQNERLERDLQSIKRLELELRQADKLRAVGQLAAGIAHEINTPIQFVGDTLRFLEESFADLSELVTASRELTRAKANGGDPISAVEACIEALERLDLDAVVAELPSAFEQALDGVRRIAEIVTAMRQFGRRDPHEKTYADVNRCLSDTLTVAGNEVRFVADVKLELGSIPLVPCYPGELNQVFLNLVVNAAHAVGDRYGKDGKRGRIGVRTSSDGATVTVAVSDDGCGIAPEHVDRIFEPFFTTKAVGTGTGQGLAIARSIVSDKHGGALTFESSPGVGTTFFVKLPLEDEGTASKHRATAAGAARSTTRPPAGRATLETEKEHST